MRIKRCDVDFEKFGSHNEKEGFFKTTFLSCKERIRLDAFLLNRQR